MSAPASPPATQPLPRVTVIVPTHNRRERLLRLLGSLERQTLPPSDFEVRIVHNYTDDGSEEVATAWCARQLFAAHYYRRNFKGPARSRDLGARDARAPILAFIDDDCVATPDWLQSGLRYFEQATPGERPLGLLQGCTRPLTLKPLRFPYRTIVIDSFSPYFETCNIFYRREAYLQVGGFSDEYLDAWGGEDMDLGWKVRTQGWPTQYAADAVVLHEVFRITFWQWLSEPLRYEKLPVLVAKHPAARTFMYRHWFLSVDTFLFHFAVLALLLLPLSPLLAAAVGAGYGLARWRTGAHLGGSPSARLARIAMGLPRGVFAWWGLLRGSLRARSFLM